jgi:hypothetical protein
MRLYSLIYLLFFPIFTLAQQDQTDSEQTKKLKAGFSLQVASSYWEQNNLNNALNEKDLAVPRKISNSIAVGNIIQHNNLRFTLLLMAMINSNSKNNYYLNQQFGAAELNGEYFIIKNEKIALSPLLGGGIVHGRTWLRNNSISGNFPEVLSAGNTTTLFNRQGYLNAAINLGFNYLPEKREHLYQLALGYRFGFSNTKWSTNLKKEVLSGAPEDALTQLYLAIKVNLFFHNYE